MELDINSITISLDAISKSISKEIRRNLDLENIIYSIKRLVFWKKNNNLDTTISIRTSVNKINIHEIRDIFTFCENEQIDIFKINNTNKLGRALNNSSILINDDEFKDILLEINVLCKDSHCRVEMPIEKYITDQADNTKLSKCTSAITTFNILANGVVIPCGFCNNQIVLGDLKINSLDSIFKQILPFDFNNEYCKNCKINNYVGKTALTKPNVLI